MLLPDTVLSDTWADGQGESYGSGSPCHLYAHAGATSSPLLVSDPDYCRDQSLAPCWAARCNATNNWNERAGAFQPWTISQPSANGEKTKHFHSHALQPRNSAGVSVSVAFWEEV